MAALTLYDTKLSESILSTKLLKYNSFVVQPFDWNKENRKSNEI